MVIIISYFHTQCMLQFTLNLIHLLYLKSPYSNRKPNFSNTKVFTAWLLLLFLFFHFYLFLYLQPFHRHSVTYLQGPPRRRVGHYCCDWLPVDRLCRADRLHRPSGVAVTSGNSISNNQIVFACCSIKLASALFQ